MLLGGDENKIDWANMGESRDSRGLYHIYAYHLSETAVNVILLVRLSTKLAKLLLEFIAAIQFNSHGLYCIDVLIWLTPF